MKSILIKNGQIINRGYIKTQDILIRKGIIERIDNQIDTHADIEIDASGKYVMPGIIDDQVHFREPGLTPQSEHKNGGTSSRSRRRYVLYGNAKRQSPFSNASTSC